MLYRTLRPEQCDGDRVLPDGIDLGATDAGGTSCYRQAFCKTPAEALQLANATRPEESVVAEVRYDAVPTDFLLVQSSGRRWQFYVDDLPTDDIESHCEIRVRDEKEAGPSRPQKGNKDFLKRRLAETFRVVYRKPVT